MSLYPPYKKFRLVPKPSSVYRISNDDTSSKVNITERSCCCSVRLYGLRGLSGPTPTVVAQ